MSRRRARLRRGGARNTGWWALSGVVLAAIVAGGAALRLLAPGAIDPETLCPKETGPLAGLVILLDLTDPPGPTQHARLRNILERKIADARTHTLISVATVAADPANRGAAFARCKPLEGDEANALYQNPRRIAERYEKEFEKPFNETLDEMLNGEGATRSPVMESLQATLADTPGFLDSSLSDRSVVIVSDLLQHSDAFSFYRGETWRTFEQSPHFGRMARNLRGVGIEIQRLPRPGTRVDPADVDNFWARYFDRSGAASVRTETLGEL